MVGNGDEVVLQECREARFGIIPRFQNPFCARAPFWISTGQLRLAKNDLLPASTHVARASDGLSRTHMLISSIRLLSPRRTAHETKGSFCYHCCQ